ncbi:MAG: sigma 54-interacting transcriptional regulator [Desulfosarcinaceae bacterium]
MSKNPNPEPACTPSPTETILESISDGVFTVDLDWRITSFNRAAEEITGIARGDAIGRICAEVFQSSRCGGGCALRQTLKNGKPVIGQSGFILRPDGRRLPISVSTAVLKNAEGRVIGGAETFRDLSEVESLRRELAGRTRVGGMESRNPLMQKIFDVLPAIAASSSTVLICGETGTGKELLARTIHEMSRQCKGPFLAVNCGALPDTLLESELFGHKRGAFTGAVKDKPGRFALARRGTLFLDEIAEVKPALQVRLLRVLQERTFEPLGGVVTETTDARIITATLKDLSVETRRGRFREDLYYRINVIRVELPPLRRRKEDIPTLVNHFIGRFNRTQNRHIEGIHGEALSLLMAHHWPGNIRELENVIERAFILCDHTRDRGRIGMDHLPDELTARGKIQTEGASMQAARALVDAQAIRSALKRNGYNRLAAARELGP